MIVATLSGIAILAAIPGAYDPLVPLDRGQVAVIDDEVVDANRKRAIPVRIYVPATPGKHEVVLFSHGLGGSSKNNPYLGNHWARRGYVCVFMQHIGSDESVWRGVPARDVMKKMSAAANAETYVARIKDVPAVISQLERWNKGGHKVTGRLNLDKIGMSGHSYGAVTTQALCGQSIGPAGPIYTDPRLDAACAMSPSPPTVGSIKAAFGSVKIPWLLMTGTKDSSPIRSQTTPEDRTKVYPNLPNSIDKYEIVLHEGTHMAFGERALRGSNEQSNPNHHRVILALSTAFWDACLKDDLAAKAWLQGAGPKAVIEPKDRWQVNVAK